MKKHNLILLIAGAICVSLTAFGFMRVKETNQTACASESASQCQPASECNAKTDNSQCQELKSCATAETAKCEPAAACKVADEAQAQTQEKQVGESVVASLTQDIFQTPSKSDFEYRVSSRFVYSKDKNELAAATSLRDLIEVRSMQQIQNYWNIEMCQFDEDGTRRGIAKGESDFLTSEQKELLTSLDYTSDLFIVGDYMRKFNSGIVAEDTLVYVLSVSPTTWAEYAGGQEALVSYLKENTYNEVNNLRGEQLQSGMIEFVVTKDGSVEQVDLLSTSGYSSIDQKFVQLIEAMPAKWEPAKNDQGENVHQKMVFFFGLMGC